MSVDEVMLPPVQWFEGAASVAKLRHEMHRPSRRLIDCHHVSTTGAVLVAQMSPTPDVCELQVPEVTHFLDFDGVVRERARRLLRRRRTPSWPR